MEIINVLITIGVIIYIISSFIKKLKPSETQSSENDAEGGSGAGWLEKLNTFVEEVKQEMEQAAEENRPDSENISTESGDNWLRGGGLPEFPAQSARNEVVVTTAPPVMEREYEDLYEPEEDLEPPPPVPCETKPDRQCRRSRTRWEMTHNLSPEKLRNAIIMSEILAPPVALREESQPGH